MARKSFGIDFGNDRFKTLFNGKCDYTVHGVAKVPKYKQALAFNGKGLMKGFMRWQDCIYAVGQTAKSLRADVLYGDDRYTPDYYLPGVLYLIADRLPKGTRSITIDLKATHAPVDVQQAMNLEHICVGVHTIETSNGKVKIDIRTVSLFDEPIGGLVHYLFNPNGTLRESSIAQARIIVIDVGGYTVDIAPIDPNGQVDPGAMTSVQGIGAHLMYTEFIQHIKTAHNHIGLKGLKVGKYNPSRLQNAMLTGRYEFAGTGEPIDVSIQAMDILDRMIGDIDDAVASRAGGWGNYDIALITGGGGGLVYTPLMNTFKNLIEFDLAEKNNSLLQYANILGVKTACGNDWKD